MDDHTFWTAITAINCTAVAIHSFNVYRMSEYVRAVSMRIEKVLQGLGQTTIGIRILSEDPGTKSKEISTESDNAAS